MQNNPQPIDPRVQAAKRKLWLGVGAIIILGFLFAIYFLFIQKASAPTTMTDETNPNTIVINDSSGDIYLTGTTPEAESVSAEIAAVSLTFSKPINPATITTTNFYVLQGIDERVPGVMSVSDDAQTVMWNFTEPALGSPDVVTALSVYVDTVDMRGAEGEAIYIPGGAGSWNVMIAAAPTNAE